MLPSPEPACPIGSKCVDKLKNRCNLQHIVGFQYCESEPAQKRFYYDRNTRECKSFDYLGCVGDKVNFKEENFFDDKVDCSRTCMNFYRSLLD